MSAQSSSPSPMAAAGSSPPNCKPEAYCTSTSASKREPGRRALSCPALFFWGPHLTHPLSPTHPPLQETHTVRIATEDDRRPCPFCFFVLSQDTTGNFIQVVLQVSPATAEEFVCSRSLHR